MAAPARAPRVVRARRASERRGPRQGELPRHPAGVRLSGLPRPQREGEALRRCSAPTRSASALTESFAMTPAAAVSAASTSHSPQAKYFAVGRIGRDQLEDYAARKGEPLADVERWLAPSLSSGEAGPAGRLSWRLQAPFGRRNTFYADDTEERRRARRPAQTATARPSSRPGPVSTVTRYRQPPPPATTGARALLAGSSDRTFLVVTVARASRSPAAPISTPTSRSRRVRAHTPAVVRAPKALDIPSRTSAAIALVIGYDHRAGVESNRPSLSDTLMLIRADPVDEDDLAALVPARPRRADLLRLEPTAAASTTTASTRRTRAAARRARCSRSST